MQEARTLPVPRHLRDAHYAGAKRLDHGTGYQYPHDHQEGELTQDYLGVDRIYYVPTDRGREVEIEKYLARFRRLRAQAAGQATAFPQKP